MDFPEQDKNFNLLDAEWIPVLYRDGTYKRVGILDALKDAGKIRQIAASNPMDRVAILRFLLALLYWCQGNPPEDKNTLPRDGFPETWFSKLNEPAHRECFNLLGEGKRFYQNAEIRNLPEKKMKPIGELLPEFPRADSVNHIRHIVHDGSYGLCPACCALGILRFSVWAPANGGYPSSVNPPSSVYLMTELRSLLHTLGRCLADASSENTPPPWIEPAEPEQPFGAVSLLAWRPRKMWLGMIEGEGNCANCGCSKRLIRQLRFAPGWPTPLNDDQAFAKQVQKAFKNRGFIAKHAKVKPVLDAIPLILSRMDDLRNACRSAQCNVPASMDQAEEIAQSFVSLWESRNPVAEEILLNEAKYFAHLTKRCLTTLGCKEDDPAAKKAANAAWLIYNTRLNELCNMCPDPLAAEIQMLSLDGVPTNHACALAKMICFIMQNNEEAFKKITRKPSMKEKEALMAEKPQKKKFWPGDPHLLKEKEPIAFPVAGKNVAEQAKAWKRAFIAASPNDPQGTNITIGPVVADLQSGIYACHDVVAISLPDRSSEKRADQSEQISKLLFSMLKLAVDAQEWKKPDRKREHPEIDSALTLLTPDREWQIRSALSRPGRTSDDKGFLLAVFAPMARHAIFSAVRGSPLRRKAAARHAMTGLEKRIDEVIAKANQSAEPAAAANTQSSVPEEHNSGGRKSKEAGE